MKLEEWFELHKNCKFINCSEMFLTMPLAVGCISGTCKKEPMSFDDRKPSEKQKRVLLENLEKQFTHRGR